MRNFAQLPFKVLTTRNVFLGNWGSPSKPLRPCLLFHIPDSHQSILSRIQSGSPPLKPWFYVGFGMGYSSHWWKPQCCSRKLWLILALQGKSPAGADLLFYFFLATTIPTHSMSTCLKTGSPMESKKWAFIIR